MTKATSPPEDDRYCKIGMTEKTQDTPDGGWELVYEQGCKCKAFTGKQFQYYVCVCGHHVRDHEFRTDRQIGEFIAQEMNR